MSFCHSSHRRRQHVHQDIRRHRWHSRRRVAQSLSRTCHHPDRGPVHPGPGGGAGSTGRCPELPPLQKGRDGRGAGQPLRQQVATCARLFSLLGSSAPMPGRAHMPVPLPLRQQCLQSLRCSCRSRPWSPWEAGASAGRGRMVGCSRESPQCTRGDAQLQDVRVCNTDTQTGMHTATASGPGLPRRATWGGFGCVVTGALLAGHRAWRKDDLPGVAVALARAAGEVVWVAGSQAEGDGR